MFDIIFLGSIFLVLATVYLLLFTENASKSYPDYVLSALLLIQAWSVLIYLLMSSGYILNFPHLYKTAVPTNYLVAPLSFLYIKIVLGNEIKFKKLDLLHFIPFLFFFFKSFSILHIRYQRKINSC